MLQLVACNLSKKYLNNGIYNVLVISYYDILLDIYQIRYKWNSSYLDYNLKPSLICNIESEKISIIIIRSHSQLENSLCSGLAVIVSNACA